MKDYVGNNTSSKAKSTSPFLEVVLFTQILASGISAVGIFVTMFHKGFDGVGLLLLVASAGLCAAGSWRLLKG